MIFDREKKKGKNFPVHFYTSQSSRSFPPSTKTFPDGPISTVSSSWSQTVPSSAAMSQTFFCPPKPPIFASSFPAISSCSFSFILIIATCQQYMLPLTLLLLHFFYLQNFSMHCHNCLLCLTKTQHPTGSVPSYVHAA